LGLFGIIEIGHGERFYLLCWWILPADYQNECCAKNRRYVAAQILTKISMAVFLPEGLV